MIYLDNAATTMHKPQAVIDAVTQAMCSLGNAGRGATSGALDAARTIHGCRAKLARLLGCPRADHVCFTPNSTAALNTVINGVVRPGDRVVTTVLEHNSVLRPLNRLAAEQGVTVEHAGCDANGLLDYDELERLVTPDTRAVVVTHRPCAKTHGTKGCILFRVATHLVTAAFLSKAFCGNPFAMTSRFVCYGIRPRDFHH